MDLQEIYSRHTGQFGYGDKGCYHNYIPIYEQWLPAATDRLLEIGVAYGHSMTMWAEAYPTADLCGLDSKLRPEAFERCDPYSNITLWEADATRRFSGFGPLSKPGFDIIIDDGSHQVEDQLAALVLWWPTLRSGGRFFIEDIQGDEALAILLDYCIAESLSWTLYDGRGEGMPPDELMLILNK